MPIDTKQKKFQLKANALFSEHGGLYHSDDKSTLDIIRQVRNLSANYIKGASIRYRIGSPIVVEIYDDPNLRALAQKKENGYIIGISAGMVFYLFNLSRALISSPYAFPKMRRDQSRYEFDTDPRTTAIYAPIEIIPRSKIPERDRVCVFLFTQLILFLTAHEFNHIIGGHCDYVAANNKYAMIDQPFGATNSAIKGEKVQALEVYADQMGFKEIVVKYLREFYSCNPYDSIGRETQRDYMRASSFAAYSIFKSFTPIEPPFDPNLNSHPPSVTRLSCIQNSFVDTMNRFGMDFVKEYHSLIVEPARWASQAFDDISNSASSDFDGRLASIENQNLSMRLQAKAVELAYGPMQAYAILPVKNWLDMSPDDRFR